MNNHIKVKETKEWEGFLHQLSCQNLSEAQYKALEILANHTVPTRKDENWKYSDLQWLRNIEFSSSQSIDKDFIQSALDQILIDAIKDFPRIVTFNGIFCAEFSTILQNKDYAFNYDHFYGSLANPIQDAMTALNLSMGQAAIHLMVPAYVKANTILMINLGLADEARTISFHPKLILTLQEGAQLSAIEINKGEGSYFSNPVYEFQLDKHSYFNYTHMNLASLSSYCCSNSYINLADHAHYQQVLVTKGSSFSRQELHINLEGEWSQADFEAVQRVTGKQHADITTKIIHNVPHCKSNQRVKNILSDKSHGVFQGKIFVDRLAQKTDAQQQNRALLLSDYAEINTKPELEIYADDVKCSHGAAIGALDQEQLFFLMSRGIPYESARQILINAFITETIEKISDRTVQDLLNQYLTLLK